MDSRTRPNDLAPSGAETVLDSSRLNALMTRAEETRTDAMVVTVGGRVVIVEWFGGLTPQRIDAMSTTKVVVNLAVGMLIRDGRIESVEDPVRRFRNLRGASMLRFGPRHTAMRVGSLRGLQPKPRDAPGSSV